MPENKNAEEYNKNLPGLGGVFNSRNLQTYHYAGNNPLKYKDPSGRTIVLSIGKDDEKKAQAIVNAINANATQEYKVKYDPFYKAWVVEPKEGSSEEPAPVPPGDNASQEEKDAYDMAKREYEEKKAFTSGINKRIGSTDLFHMRIGEDAQREDNPHNPSYSQVSNEAVEDALNGGGEELKNQIKDILPSSKIRGQSTTDIQGSNGGSSAVDKARQRLINGERNRHGLPNQGERLFP